MRIFSFGYEFRGRTKELPIRADSEEEACEHVSIDSAPFRNAHNAEVRARAWAMSKRGCYIRYMELTRFGGQSSSCYFDEKKGGSPCPRPVDPMLQSSGSRWWSWYELALRPATMIDGRLLTDRVRSATQSWFGTLTTCFLDRSTERDSSWLLSLVATRRR